MLSSFLIPTRRLALVVVAVGLVAFAAGTWWVFVAANIALLLAVIVDRIAMPSPDALVIDRELPEAVTLGERAQIRWIVTNRTGHALTVGIADEIAPSLGAGTRRFQARVPARSRVVAKTEIAPGRRGRFDIREMAVRIHGPMGLVARQTVRDVPGVMRVHPVFKSRDEAELRVDKGRMIEVGLRSAQGLGGGTEFDQLREYSVDDDVRRMDWSATARSGKPIVRTYRAERNQVVINLLDTSRLMAARIEGVPRIEHAMDAVMMLTALGVRLGDRVGMVAFDTVVRKVVAPGSGRGQLTRVTEAMYDLEPELVEADFNAAFAETLARFRRRAMLVVYTDLVEQSALETLVPALPVVARDHLVVVAAVQDPQVVTWASGVPVDAEGAYRKAAAIKALHERRRITKRLTGMGVTVVDAPPGELAPKLADVYLAVKATGRL